MNKFARIVDKIRIIVISHTFIEACIREYPTSIKKFRRVVERTNDYE